MLVFLFIQREGDDTIPPPLMYQQGGSSGAAGSIQQPLLKQSAAEAEQLRDFTLMEGATCNKSEILWSKKALNHLPTTTHFPRVSEALLLVGPAVASLDFWILFAAFLFSAGAGLVLINNLGQVRFHNKGDSQECLQVGHSATETPNVICRDV